MVLEEDTVEVPLKDRIAEQLSFFKRSILDRLGITPKEASRYNGFTQLEPSLASEQRQLRLKERFMANLKNKGILATKIENLEFYKDKFNLTPGYTAPELYLLCPGGAVIVDERTQSVKVYLNPFLDMFKPDYQLLTVLEEAIHWFQLKHGSRTVVTNEDEIDAQNRILKIADFLGLSEERIKETELKKESYR